MLVDLTHFEGTDLTRAPASVAYDIVLDSAIEYTHLQRAAFSVLAAECVLFSAVAPRLSFSPGG